MLPALPMHNLTNLRTGDAKAFRQRSLPKLRVAEDVVRSNEAHLLGSQLAGGVTMSDAQVNALWGFLAAFSTVLWIAAAAIRAHVVSPATYEKDVAVALATEPPVK
jgi:hypothetical protein